jgi:hypothetical protein
VIDADGAGQVATVERNTTRIVHAVAVADVVWCVQRCEVTAAVEVVATRIVYEFPVDNVAAGVIHKAAGVNAVVVENITSRIINNVVATDTLSCACRRRTVAVAACAVAIVSGIIIAVYGVLLVLLSLLCRSLS